jgi:hypothetical protein
LCGTKALTRGHEKRPGIAMTPGLGGSLGEFGQAS